MIGYDAASSLAILFPRHIGTSALALHKSELASSDAEETAQVSRMAGVDIIKRVLSSRPNINASVSCIRIPSTVALSRRSQDGSQSATVSREGAARQSCVRGREVVEN